MAKFTFQQPCDLLIWDEKRFSYTENQTTGFSIQNLVVTTTSEVAVNATPSTTAAPATTATTFANISVSQSTTTTPQGW